MHQFFQSLEKDHNEVRDILEQLAQTSEGAAKTKEKLFMKLKHELLPHMKGEEKGLYPVLMENRDVREKAMESLEEHHVAETVFNELDKLPKDKENWSAKLKVFKEIVEHHIEEEEDEVFDIAGEILDDDQLDQIMESFENEKEKIKEQLG